VVLLVLLRLYAGKTVDFVESAAANGGLGFAHRSVVYHDSALNLESPLWKILDSTTGLSCGSSRGRLPPFLACIPRTLIACGAAGVLFLLGVAFNLTWVLRNRAHQPFEFEEARKVIQFVGDKDLVILDRGADGVPGMYAFLWADDNQFFPFMDEAVVKRIGVLNEVDDAIRNQKEKVLSPSIEDQPASVGSFTRAIRGFLLREPQTLTRPARPYNLPDGPAPCSGCEFHELPVVSASIPRDPAAFRPHPPALPISCRPFPLALHTPLACLSW
jgi:hypothetical protein